MVLCKVLKMYLSLNFRACKFPLICGNTVIHEEAFCYHRGTYCEYIFENNKRDFLFASDDVDTDYLDQADYEIHSNESESGTFSVVYTYHRLISGP